MDIQTYIESGVLEEYCLGLLNEQDQASVLSIATVYPEIRAELNAVEVTIERLDAATAVEPAPHNRNNILAALGFADDEALDINNLPATNHNADHELWLQALAHLIPHNPAEDLWMQQVKKDAHYQQMLVYTRIDVPEEEHGEFLESFFILKGHCECMVGDKLHFLNPGDFLQIPMNTRHDIKVTSPHVVAILQYEFL